MSKSEKVTYQADLSGAIFIVFLVLKLVGVIDWSWWWVTAPLWIPFAVILAVLAFFAAGVGAFLLCSGIITAFNKWPRASAVSAAIVALSLLTYSLF